MTRSPTIPAHRFFILILITLAGSLLVAMLLPPQTVAALPPRPTPQPTQTPRHHHARSDKDEIVGAQIELRVQPGLGGLWAVVQWQDASGGWHDVEGWRGSLDGSARQLWWVAGSDFGKGPFRWNVYQHSGSKPLAESASFRLPQSANEIVRVELSLPPH